MLNDKDASGEVKSKQELGKNYELKVFKIQRTCVHDGPGIRTTVFFKGCGLRCLWCQNPEGLDASLDIGEKKYTVQEIFDTVIKDKKYYFSTGGGVTLSGGEPMLQNPDALISFLKKLNKEKINVAVETTLFAPWQNVINRTCYT